MIPPILPDLVPLPYLDIESAFELQQRLVRSACAELPGEEMFRADVGVVPDLGRPHTTARVEAAIAGAFEAPAAALVQGAGTGAIRAVLSAGPWTAGDRRLLVHDAPDYSTTARTFRDGLVEAVRVDFDDDDAFAAALEREGSPDWVYVQHTRQRLEDTFDPLRRIEQSAAAGRRVIVDDNYAVVRTPQIGVQTGASASAFSLFKLHGPEGAGIVIGDQDIVDEVHRANYSGGGQVQGPQAIAALQALITAPLNWAFQSREAHHLAAALRQGAVPAIVDARLVNAQDLCVIAVLDAPVAMRVRERAAAVGAAPYPVGSNSRYEIAPLIYRLSGSTLQDRPELAEWCLRINPMRAGADLVIDILRHATQ